MVGSVRQAAQILQLWQNIGGGGGSLWA